MSRTRGLSSIGLLLMSLLLTSRAAAWAQSSNGAVTLHEETISAGGERVGSGNLMSLVGSLGGPVGGPASNAQYTLAVGYPAGASAPPDGAKEIRVEGDTTETAASVVVNGIPAALNGMHFTAEKILLREGANTITTTARDAAGNNASRSITVYLDTHPPARPTIAGTPVVTTMTSYILTGTKTIATSIWINGVQAVALGDSTSWSKTVSLAEGDNVFVVITKDAAGNTSATNTVNIVVDNLPPVITITSAAKTNLNPSLVTGTVDDSVTTVVVSAIGGSAPGGNGIPAARSGKTFQAWIPLTLGANTVTVTATSPNHYVASRTSSLELGTVPAIQSVQPPDGAIIYMGIQTAIQVTATDPEQDPIAYEMLLDGAPLSTWSSTATATWTPGANQFGLHTISVGARDAYGGSDREDGEVFVVHQPVQHP